MLKRLMMNRSTGSAEHQEAVASRVRGLSSVSHDLSDQTPEDLRRRLNGGRSELSQGARTAVNH